MLFRSTFAIDEFDLRCGCCAANTNAEEIVRAPLTICGVGGVGRMQPFPTSEEATQIDATSGPAISQPN